MIEMLEGPGAVERELPAKFMQFIRYGIDIRKEPMLIYPTLHYQNGGIKINAKAETGVPGLYAAGEVTGGVHGENRLMGNSLLDVTVFGRRAGQVRGRVRQEPDRASWARPPSTTSRRMQKELEETRRPGGPDRADPPARLHDAGSAGASTDRPLPGDHALTGDEKLLRAPDAVSPFARGSPTYLVCLAPLLAGLLAFGALATFFPQGGNMNIHEYQAKEILKKYGVAVPRGIVASHTRGGGSRRGRAGHPRGGREGADPRGRPGQGRRREGGQGAEAAREAARRCSGCSSSPTRPGRGERRSSRSTWRRGCDIARELYLGMVLDRATGFVTLMASTEGGTEIEEVAAKTPEKIHRKAIDPAAGFSPTTRGSLAYRLGLTGDALKNAQKFIAALYRAFIDSDASLVEINPLVVTAEGEVLALDAKMNFDNSALYRHADIEALRDTSEEDPRELEASKFGLNYISLDGQIGCMVNGAGLAMATMDIIKHYGDGTRQFPRRGRRRQRRAGAERLPAHPLRPQGEGGAGQHLRRHHALRHHRRGHPDGGQGGEARRAAGGAPAGHQRGTGAEDARGERASDHHRRNDGRGRREGRRGRARLIEKGASDMSILVNKNTRLICQGITGSNGKFHAEQCQKYGTNLVGGVTPGKGGTEVIGVPVFDTVRAGGEKAGANATMIFVPAPFAADAILEAADAGIGVIVCITEGIPALDMVKVKRALSRPRRSPRGAQLPGRHHPRRVQGGHHARPHPQAGPRGRHLPLGHAHLRSRGPAHQAGIGQTTCLGIGGDPIIGTTFVDALRLFKDDPATEGIVMIGEIGGSAEEEAAAYIKANIKVPVVSFIAGQTAPKGKRMGHAGAIIAGGKGTAAEKMAALEAAGVSVVKSPADLGKNDGAASV